MKKIISVVLSVLMLSCLFNTVVFAEGKINYESIYLEFAKEADNSSEHIFNKSQISGFIFADLNMDEIPELLSYVSSETRYDEEGNVLFFGDDPEKYNNPSYIKKSHLLVNGFSVVNGKIKEHTPWKKSDGGVDYLGMSFLPDEIPNEDTEEFTGTLISSDGNICLSMYSVLYYPNFSAVTYSDDNGFSYERKDMSEILNNEYTYVDIPMASYGIVDGDSKFYKAIAGLVEKYRKNSEVKCSEWAREELLEAKSKNLVPPEMNYEDYTKSITRAEFAGIAMHLYQALSEEELNWHGGYITDIDNSLYATYIRGAYVLGITSGTGVDDKTGGAIFSPESNVTREQIATMLCRIIKMKKFGTDSVKDETKTLDISSAPVFDDDASISGYAREAVGYMSKHGIIKGTDEKHFSPKNTATREQAILLSLRMYNGIETFINDEKKEEEKPEEPEYVKEEIKPFDVIGKTCAEIRKIAGSSFGAYDEESGYVICSENLYLGFDEEGAEISDTSVCNEVVATMGICFPKIGRKTYTLEGFIEIFKINAENLSWSEVEEDDGKIAAFQYNNMSVSVYTDEYNKINADSVIKITAN